MSTMATEADFELGHYQLTDAKQFKAPIHEPEELEGGDDQ